MKTPTGTQLEARFVAMADFRNRILSFVLACLAAGKIQPGDDADATPRQSPSAYLKMPKAAALLVW
jgi:hypothetical protein